MPAEPGPRTSRERGRIGPRERVRNATRIESQKTTDSAPAARPPRVPETRRGITTQFAPDRWRRGRSTEGLIGARISVRAHARVCSREQGLQGARKRSAERAQPRPATSRTDTPNEGHEGHPARGCKTGRGNPGSVERNSGPDRGPRDARPGAPHSEHARRAQRAPADRKTPPTQQTAAKAERPRRGGPRAGPPQRLTV